MTVLSIKIKEQRIYSIVEAAHYCRMNSKAFRMHCPVKPIELEPGKKSYDKVDIDRWIEGSKGALIEDDDAILSKLG